MVHRPSFLALDLLDCRTIHPIDDGLCPFRNSAPDRCRTEAELARVHLLQLEPCSFIRGSGSRTAAGLAELRHYRRHARRGTLSAWGNHPETCGPAQPSRESQISEHSEHHHPGHIHLRVQVPAPGRDCARARLPRQHSTLPAAGDRTHACLVDPADVRGGVAAGDNHHLRELAAAPGAWAPRGSDMLFALGTRGYFVVRE